MSSQRRADEIVFDDARADARCSPRGRAAFSVCSCHCERSRFDAGRPNRRQGARDESMTVRGSPGALADDRRHISRCRRLASGHRANHLPSHARVAVDPPSLGRARRLPGDRAIDFCRRRRTGCGRTHHPDRGGQRLLARRGSDARAIPAARSQTMVSRPSHRCDRGRRDRRPAIGAGMVCAGASRIAWRAAPVARGRRLPR